MKNLFRILSGILAVFLAHAALAQPQQPVSSIAITALDVGNDASVDFAGPAVNESFGAYTSPVRITATPTGGSGPYTIVISINGTPFTTTFTGTAGEIIWTPPQPGAYFISATVTDGSGVLTSSLPARYFATGTTIVNPLPNTLLPVGSSVVIQAAATPVPTAPGGFVQRMEFYSNGTLIGTDSTYPYSFIYTPDPTLIPPQPYSLTAVSYDNTGAQIGTSTAVPITTVTPVATPPTVSITSPLNSATVGIDAIPVAITATSTSGFINKVELYIDGVLFGTDRTYPYGFTWTPTVLGTYRLTAITYDDKSNAVASPTNVVTIAVPGSGGGGGGSKLSPTAINVEPGSAAPGDRVSFTVTASNSDAADDFRGTADFDVVLTHMVTGATYSFSQIARSPAGGLISAATTDPTTGQNVPGIGTFVFSEDLPTKTLQAGNYRATVTMRNITNQGLATPSFSATTTRLTVTGKPDLQITSLTYQASTSYVGGDIIPMQLTYVNRERTAGTNNVPYVPGIGSTPHFVRIQVVLSNNPTFGDSDDFQLTLQDINANNISTTDNTVPGNPSIPADGVAHTFNWHQLLPGNLAGSYYVLAKIDQMDTLDENDSPEFTINGNNVWGLNPSATLITLEPANFQTVALGSHAENSPSSASGYSDNPALSGDGRYVAFVSDATDLEAGDTNGLRDVYLYDSQTKRVRRLSKPQQGIDADGPSASPAFAGGGRYVAFSSEASNLVFGDTNAYSDIFVVDLLSPVVTRVSVGVKAGDLTTDQGNNPSYRPSISQNGRFVVFESSATNLDRDRTGLSSGVSHIYIHDRSVDGRPQLDVAGNTSTRLVDVGLTTPGSTVANAGSTQASISADGSTITFSSRATNLVSPGTTTGRQHIYTRPRASVGTGTSGIRLVSVAHATAAEGNGASQSSSVSADGRYIAFSSLSSNLVTGDTNRVSDVFVYDTAAPVGAPVVRRMSVTTTGGQAYDSAPAGSQLGSINPSISADGRYVAFASLATNLTKGDALGQYQGDGATATATVNGLGGISALNLVTGGTSYSQSTPPIVIITDATGTGATAEAIVNASGVVTGFTVIEGGSGYSPAPTVTIASDANKGLDIFVHDRDAAGTGTFDAGAISTQIVSVNTFGYQTGSLLGVPSTPASNIFPAISANGRFVALPSDSENVGGLAFGTTNRVPRDGNGFRDIFLVDRRTTAATASTTPPTVTITSPGTGSPILIDTAVQVTAAATAATLDGEPVGEVAKVDFYVGSTRIGTSERFPFATTWTPTATGSYLLSAIVTDSNGSQGVSPNVAIKVTAIPSVGVTAPAQNAQIDRGTTVKLRATAAPSVSGAAIASVQFLLNGGALATGTPNPAVLHEYTASWTPAQEGTYTISATATDGAGMQATATNVTVSVVVPTTGPDPVANQAPTAALTSVTNGTVVKVNGSLTLSATAGDSDGTIDSVQFFANGTAIGAPVTTSSGGVFTTSFKPTAEGSYRITAVARDNTGATTTSTGYTIFAISVNDAIAAGRLGFDGYFAAINARGKSATFIGYDPTADRIYFFPGLALSATATSASFNGSGAGGRTITGTFMDSSASGSLDGGRVFVSSPQFGASPAAGYYAGSLNGRSASTLVGIVDSDGALVAYAADGDFQAVGRGNLRTDGSFAFAGSGGSQFSGKIDPATGFLSGSVTSASIGSLGFTGATTAGVVFSDGFLRNLSTRGNVGVGADEMIAGFVVADAEPKQVLIRAIGPGLTPFGVNGVLANPELRIYELVENKPAVLRGQNDDWNSALAPTASTVGAFPLPAGSRDAAVVLKLPKGSYTANVSGVGGTTGIALVELYDVDNPQPFSAQKVINVSTRGRVGGSQGQLIAGFVISGTTSKKVLIRGVGPTLAGFGLPGALTDPVLRLIRSVDGADSVIRENDNWEAGNDPALVVDASSRVGAFPLASGTKDAVLLINLPPGQYSAVLDGVGGASGVALIEVYEVP